MLSCKIRSVDVVSFITSEKILEGRWDQLLLLLSALCVRNVIRWYFLSLSRFRVCLVIKNPIPLRKNQTKKNKAQKVSKSGEEILKSSSKSQGRLCFYEVMCAWMIIFGLPEPNFSSNLEPLKILFKLQMAKNSPFCCKYNLQQSSRPQLPLAERSVLNAGNCFIPGQLFSDWNMAMPFFLWFQGFFATWANLLGSDQKPGVVMVIDSDFAWSKNWRSSAEFEPWSWHDLCQIMQRWVPRWRVKKSNLTPI